MRPLLRFPCPNCGTMREGVAIRSAARCKSCANAMKWSHIQLRTTIPVYHLRIIKAHELCTLRKEDLACWWDNGLHILSHGGCL